MLAFRKVNNMARTTNAKPGIFRQLAAGKGGFKLKWPGGGKHVEADLSRQVMVLAKHGKPKHIFHISSGAPRNADDPRQVPDLPQGLRHEQQAGWSTPSTSSGGYATHGYPSVPTYPASHGCLRNPIPELALHLQVDRLRGRLLRLRLSARCDPT